MVKLNVTPLALGLLLVKVSVVAFDLTQTQMQEPDKHCSRSADAVRHHTTDQ